MARLGARIARHENIASTRDAMSHMALTRYLELMPDDDEVRQTLAQLPPLPHPRPGMRRWLLWLLFVSCGVSTAGAIHFNGIPESFDPAPVTVAAVTRVRLHPVPRPVSAPVVASAVADAPPIVIRAVGDVVLGSDFPKHRLPGAAAIKRMESLRTELRNADIVVGNLEGVLNDRGTARKDTSKPGLFTFRMPEGYAATLREMGFDVLSMANNHTMDFGTAGMASTLRALQEEGIHPVGVPGAEMAVIKVKNTSVAFLNYSYLPAFARLDDVQRIEEEIKHARTEADIVVVLVHGGKEGSTAAGTPSGDEFYLNEYRGNILQFAHLAIDSGACAVFGHGPHVVRPFELYKDKPIFFSLGNFVGYRSLSTKGSLANSIIAEVRFNRDGKFLGAGIIPLKLDRSGIPAADYSSATLDALDGLLDERLEKRPVLELATRTKAEEAAPTPLPIKKTSSRDSAS